MIHIGDSEMEVCSAQRWSPSKRQQYKIAYVEARVKKCLPRAATMLLNDLLE